MLTSQSCDRVAVHLEVSASALFGMFMANCVSVAVAVARLDSQMEITHSAPAAYTGMSRVYINPCEGWSRKNSKRLPIKGKGKGVDRRRVNKFTDV